ncbi:hypothetical protein SALBM135S_09587 [Streptomyces alboniger]
MFEVFEAFAEVGADGSFADVQAGGDLGGGEVVGVAQADALGLLGGAGLQAVEGLLKALVAAQGEQVVDGDGFGVGEVGEGALRDPAGLLAVEVGARPSAWCGPGLWGWCGL